MLVCHGCHRHVRVDESTCPFCGVAITTITAPTSARLGPLALMAGLTVLACDCDVADDGMTTTSNGESGNTLGDGDGDPNESAEAAASDYGGPEEAEFTETPCTAYSEGAVVIGSNDLTIDTGGGLNASCGGFGIEEVYSFTATADGDYTFAVTDASFEATLYVVGLICEPLEELGCAVPPNTVTLPMVQDEIYYVVVDSSDAGGTATLSITLN